MKRIIILSSLLAFCAGCSNLLVPRTDVKLNVMGQQTVISSPKNYVMTNVEFQVTQVNRFGDTNYGSLKIGGAAAVMDPTVVQMSGDTFNTALKTSIEGALQLMSKGAPGK